MPRQRTGPKARNGFLPLYFFVVGDIRKNGQNFSDLNFHKIRTTLSQHKKSSKSRINVSMNFGEVETAPVPARTQGASPQHLPFVFIVFIALLKSRSAVSIFVFNLFFLAITIRFFYFWQK